jgi:hypothetical protein
LSDDLVAAEYLYSGKLIKPLSYVYLGTYATSNDDLYLGWVKNSVKKFTRVFMRALPANAGAHAA